MKAFKELLNQELEKLFLVVWPPLGEEKELDIDMSFGFVLRQEPKLLYIITTDENDRWTPCFREEVLPPHVYPWEVFAARMNSWMKSECDDALKMEYYNVTEGQPFCNIIRSRVQSIECLGLAGNPEPFGVKIVFEDDYILSTPISDGNTVETAHFNKNNNLMNFEAMGALERKVL